MTTKRERAYKTVIDPLSVAEVARELGVTPALVRRAIKDGDLVARAGGKVSGAQLARFLAAKR
jgi:transposase-like protein